MILFILDKKVKKLGGNNLKKIMIFLSVALVFTVVFNGISYADESEIKNKVELPGKIRSDGSYQFSEEEMSRLNLFKETKARSLKTISIAEFLNFSAPEYFNSLEENLQKYLEGVPWQTSVAISPTGSTDGPHEGTTVDISKYGSSLRGRMIVDRPAMSEIPDDFAYIVAHISIQERPSNKEVAYAINTSHWVNGTRGRCTATVIVDPKSGTYRGWGTYTIPLYHNISGWYLATVNIYTPNFSYLNPYN